MDDPAGGKAAERAMEDSSAGPDASAVGQPARRIARLRVRRGGPGEPPRWELFEVPYEEGDSVLDALIWVRQHRDAGLAVRYSCINANACKECVALIDGRVGYLCTARLKESVTVEPLPKRPLIRDLVTDVVPESDRLEGSDAA